MNRIFIFGIVACVGCAAATEMQAQTVSSPAKSPQEAGSIDFAHAKPLHGRTPTTRPSSQTDPAALQKLLSSRGVVPGQSSDTGAGKFSSIPDFQIRAPVSLVQSS